MRVSRRCERFAARRENKVQRAAQKRSLKSKTKEDQDCPAVDDETQPVAAQKQSERD